jgi:hypothetical protein
MRHRGFGSRGLRAMVRVGAVALLTAAALITPAFVDVASAAGPSVSVSPSMVSRGATVTISGVVPTTGAEACAPSDPVTVISSAALFPGDGFGPNATRDASGNFSVVYRVPSTTPATTYVITLRCGGGNVGVSTDLIVTSAVTAQPNLTG